MIEPEPDATALPPDVRFVTRLAVRVGAPIEVGATSVGHRRIIPIRGGTAAGPGLRGRILPGGADFQILRSATLTELEAKYAVETDTGERVYIDNYGLRAGSAEDIAALVAGDPVDPARIYFRCTPRFSVAGTASAWLESRIFIGSGTRLPNEVRIDVFVVE